MLRYTTILIALAISVITAEMQAYNVVVVDSASRVPLPNAPVYDRSGALIGLSNAQGIFPVIDRASYPITV